MNNVENILSGIKNNLYFGPDDKKIEGNFFKSSLLHFAISLEIGEGQYKNDPVSFEKICASIPTKIGSRSSIQNILNEAVDKGFFVKRPSSFDKRIKKYLFSENYSQMIFDWIDFYKDNLNN